MQFLYLAPVGLVQANLNGEIAMINPLSAQLLIPLPPDGKLDANRLMAMVSDVTLEVQREQSGLDRRLRAAAGIDVLTQMPTRSVVHDLLDKAIRRGADEAGKKFAVFFLNCDRFKQINDALGHAAGDEVLGLMAERLRSTLRQTSRGGTVASGEAAADRIGSDEFVVLIGALGSTEVATQRFGEI